MRGKLRDKRVDARRDRIRRDMVERRRTPKREHHIAVLLNRQLEEEYMLDEEVVIFKGDRKGTPLQ